jgi:membrane protease YdiL (CAAX protease family)
LFFALGTNEKLVVAFGTVVLGPICEELLFRGAIYRPLRQNHSAPAVIVVTAVLFAVVHLDPHRFPPLFIMGCVLGYLRWASGSLVPPVLMHMAFNTVPFVELMSYAEKPAADAELLPLAVEVIAGATAITLCAMALVHVIARKSRTASGARRDDEG